MFKGLMYIYLIFFSKQVGHHIGKFVFFLPISNTLKNLLTSKDNLLNEINPESANMFNPNDIFKIQQENLVKTAIEKYIKKLTVSLSVKTTSCTIEVT